MTQPSLRVTQQMAALVREVSAAGKNATNAAAAEAKRIHVVELRRVAGADMRLSGVGRKGAAVNVRYRPATSDTNPVAVVQAVGPVHLVEHPSKPHTIVPRSIGRSSRARRAVASGSSGVYRGASPLSTPFGPRYRVQHPGVRSPRRPWARALPRVKPAADRIIRRQYGSAFARGVR